MVYDTFKPFTINKVKFVKEALNIWFHYQWAFGRGQCIQLIIGQVATIIGNDNLIGKNKCTEDIIEPHNKNSRI